MRLTHIEAINLKGPAFSYDLSPAVAIVGPNFAGKTRIIDAIRLALLGYLPELGKTNKATWGLASGDPMTVLGEIDDIRFSRRYWLEKDSVKDRLLVSAPDFDFAQFNANPLLNAQLYFTMTERERTNFVFNAIPLPVGLTVDSIVSSLEQISFEEEHSDSIEKAKREYIATVRKFLGAGDLHQSIDNTVAGLKEEFAAANRRAKETIGTVRVLTELKNREAEFASAKGLDGQIKQAQQALDEANRVWGGIEERNTQAAEYKAKSRKLTVETDFDAEIKKLEIVIAEAKATLVPDPDAPDVVGATGKRDMLLNRRGQLALDLAAIKKESEQILKHNDCPTCGTPGKAWKKKLQTKYATQLKATAEAIEITDGNLRVLEDELEKLIKDGEQVRQIRRKNASLQSNIDIWTGRRDGFHFQKEAWDRQLHELRQQIKMLPKVEPVPAAEATLASQALVSRKALLDELIDKRAAYDRYQQDVRRAAQAAIEHNEAKARLAVTKAVLSRLQDVKTVIVDGAFMELLRVANSIVGPVLKTPLAFYENEVGRWEGEKFIGHGTFSGTEQALTFVAIAAALAQQSPLRILIFDELGRLDEARKYSVVGLLVKALDEGFIDQFIVAGTVPVAGWKDLQTIELK